LPNLIYARSLLDKGLVIIDTPGLESVVAHHEDITRKAIASAHIAIWVQSVDQLGGNSREWQFLTNTVRQHFRKFLTVVNMWDQVLDPEDDHDRAKPEAERVAEKLNIVRDHFRHHLSDQAEAELVLMTNDQHLMGVSAKWALSKDSEQRQRSGIQHLTKRIADLCSSGEAQQEIFYKPLKQLSSIQATLAAALDDEINVLSDQRDLKDQQNELALLDQEIKNLMLEQQQTAKNSKDEHYRAAQTITKEIKENLVPPLKGLSDEINIVLTESHIKREVEAGHNNIGLPKAAEEKFQQVTKEVGEAWSKQTRKIETALNDLKAEYIDAMKNHSVQMEKSLGGMKIELPEIKIDLQLDLSRVMEYQNKQWELERNLEKYEQEIYECELEQAKLVKDESKLRAAEANRERAARQLRDLGSPPSPMSYEVSNSSWYNPFSWGSTKTCHDYSNVREHERQRDEIKVDLTNREKALEQLMQEELAKSEKRQTVEVLRRKAEQKLAKIEKERKEQEQLLTKEKQEMIADTLRHLRNSTTGELNSRINQLEKFADQSIQQLFNDQLTALLACVEEQFTQPLLAKQAKREEVLKLFEHGKNDIEQRKAEVIQARKELHEVMEFTNSALAN
jgi:DNA repair exonuclease SbcCD ATPase subunit